MPSPEALWSYVHADDDAEGGRIAQLAHDLGQQYEMITGDPIDVFLDQASLRWGDDWRNEVDTALESIAFFIAVITPRYFRSAECRRELQLFVRRADRLGVRDLILPIVYVDVAELHASAPTDDAIALVKTFQWEDWRYLRLKDRTSEDYRAAVARIAQRLADANDALSAPPAAIPPTSALPPVARASTPVSAPSDTGPDDDDELGALDRMAIAEEALPKWTKTVEDLSVVINEIAALASEAGMEMERGDKGGKGFAARLTVAKNLARQLKPKADRVVELANDFTGHLYGVDRGLLAMIAAAPEQAIDDESRRQICEFFLIIKTMVESSSQGMAALQSMSESMKPIEELSRDMRPPLKTIRAGLTAMIEGQAVMDEWVRQIDESGIECAGPD